MKRSPLPRLLLLALLALQVALLPVVSALASPAVMMSAAGCASDSDSSHCDCPCCPDGLPFQGTCSPSCATAAAIPPVVSIPHSQITRAAPGELVVLPVVSQIYSPVNPPPIA